MSIRGTEVRGTEVRGIEVRGKADDNLISVAQTLLGLKKDKVREIKFRVSTRHDALFFLENMGSFEVMTCDFHLSSANEI